MSKVLALDLATTTGWAFCDADGLPAWERSGAWSLKSCDDASADARSFRLWAHLCEMEPGLLVFEEVTIPHRGSRAAQLYGEFKATVQRYADHAGIPCHGVPVDEIKSFATGNRKATKPVMAWAAQDKWGDCVDPREHDRIDALWLLDCWIAKGKE